MFGVQPVTQSVPRPHTRRAILLGIGVFTLATQLQRPAAAINCVDLLPGFRDGASDAAVAEYFGLPLAVVRSCRSELSRPIHVGPAGVPPAGAAGAPPVGAAGRPPFSAPGPPPMGAVGPPPLGRDLKRLP